MLDKDGYRPNVGIIVLNDQHQVLIGRRKEEGAWQFPQGGIQQDETPLQAMYRELYEEIGLQAHDVKVLGHTKEWLYYDVPQEFIRPYNRTNYRGQKQIWYLLQLIVDDGLIELDHFEPEFDAWLWCNYWQPVEWVIRFKQQVYYQALQELEPLLAKTHVFIKNKE